MDDIPHYDCVILGAGIAGISLARSLVRNGNKVLVLNQSGAGDGASGAPLALLNPATGRRARKAWNAETCMAKTLAALDDVKNRSGKDIYCQNGVLRPAVTEKLADNFRKALTKYDWPPGWIEWIDELKINYLLEGVTGNSGGLMIKTASTVRLGLFIQEAVTLLKKDGARFITAQHYEIEKKSNSYAVTIDGTSFQTRYIVNAAGYWVQNFQEWDFIDFEFVKGQLLTVSFKSDIQIKHSVSSLGYFAVMPENNFEMVVGSTYEHNFSDIIPDKNGRNYLLKKLQTTFPGLTGSIDKTSLWSGVRVSTQNRLPAAGEHPQHKGMYIFNGLGSKGLLYGPHCADLLADFILNQKPLPAGIDVKRYF